tara:strand:- start:37 stop:1974 length:1938 start_codon:yes stop_codon:yes gene_type:complete
MSRRENRPEVQGYTPDWGTLYERWKNKELGKDTMDMIQKGIVDDYNSNPDLQKLVHGVGDFYQDLRTVDGKEKYNPLNYLTAGTLRTLEAAGWLVDKTAGKFLKDTIHNTLRVDPRIAALGSEAIQIAAAPKAISKGIGLLNKGIASKKAHNLAYKAGQSARRLKDRLGSVPTTAYDDAIGIFELPPDEFRALSKLSKQPGINSLTLARRFQLQKQALERKYGKRPSSDLQGMATPDDQPRPKLPPKVTTNEKMKQALLNDEAIILNPTYRGGKITVRDEADFFDVSAALIGPGQEIKKDSKGRKIPYDRKKVTEFGGKKGDQREFVFKHLQEKLGKKNITRAEFDKYAQEQIEAEKDLRKAIKLLNLRAYAAEKGIDLSEYPTKEAQLEFLNEINKAKRNKTGYTDYRETFDYGHIISAKTGFRLEDLGMNRISNTEIEAAHNIVSRDPYTQKIIEILQEGNRERGSRRDFIPEVQMMRNTAGTVAEDFIKWRSNQPGARGPNLYKILDKFIPREQHENYLRFVQKRFYERRQVAGSFKNFLEFELGIPFKRFNKLGRKLQLQLRRDYEKEVAEAGIVVGRQQYDQAYQWMVEAIDEFIGLHHSHKAKRIRAPKEAGALYDIEDLMPRDIETLLDMILPDSIND